MIEIKNKTLKNKKFIDLFAGIGGFRLALESLGAECVFSSDWDKFAQDTYEENFGERPYGDITIIDEKEIPDHDILCAGFPCQPFSISGKQGGFDDSRGTLFFDVARIVKEKKPSIVFMENVRNFEGHDEGRTLTVVKDTMEELGYDFYYKVLNAADFGVPQNRERIYMIGFKKELNVTQFEFPKPIELSTHLEDLLVPEAEAESLYVNRDDVVFTKSDIDYNVDKPYRLGSVNKGGQGDRIYSIKGVGITLSATGGGNFSKTGGYLINGRLRRLHLRECARLMGFPDGYKYNERPAQAYKQFGNSVVVDVLQYIAIEFSKYI